MPQLNITHLLSRHTPRTDMQRFCAFFYDMIHKPAEDASDIHIVECDVNGVPSMAITIAHHVADPDSENVGKLTLTPVFVGVNMGMAVAIPVAEVERVVRLHNPPRTEN